MELIRSARDPWGQEVLLGMSWDLIGVFFGVGLTLIVLHMLFMWLWAPRLRRSKAAGRPPR
jgi:hypothetical protein